MRIKFKMNLGSNEGNKLGLHVADCQQGMECECSVAVADELVKSGIAEIVHNVPDPTEPPTSKAAPLQNVPPPAKGKSIQPNKESK